MKPILIALLSSLIASGAAAQDFHGGVSLDYATPHSGDEQTSTSILAGIMFGAQPFQYGFEAEVGIPLDGNDDYDTRRLRLLGSYDFGSYTAIIGAGITRYDFGDGDDDDGTNVGLGLEWDLTRRGVVRGELIRDFLDDSFTAAVTTARVGFIYNF